MKAIEYRKMGKQPITTESGATFIVGRIPGERLLALFNDHDVEMGDVQIGAAKALEMAVEIVPEFTEEVVARGEGDDEFIGVEELMFSDLIEIFNHVMASGVGEEAVAKAKAFRLESAVPGGSASGESVRLPPDGSPPTPGGGDSLEPGTSDVRPGSGD